MDGGSGEQPGDVDIVRFGVESQVRQAVDDQFERDAQLHPGEVDTETDVVALSERRVALDRTADVEPVGIFPPRRVAVSPRTSRPVA